MTYHFVVGDLAAKPLIEALSQQENTEIIILKDILNVGPIARQEGQSFSEMRTAFWQMVVPAEKQEIVVEDMEHLLEVSKKMYEDETVKAWFWMAPLPADICAYYWILFYLSKHTGRFMVINIAGLPFLNEAGKLYFPKSIAELSAKEIIKATKLARPVSNSEVEVDTYEWKQIQAHDAAIRTMGGGKKINHQAVDFYDHLLLAQCSNVFQKSHKIINAAMGRENNIPTGDLYLAWRLRELAHAGTLQIQGENGKSPKDFEVKLFESANSGEEII
jgi:hypothetical protein